MPPCRRDPSSSTASRTESEIWSAILSGCPSVTDSDVKVWRVVTSLLLELSSPPEASARRMPPPGRCPPRRSITLSKMAWATSSFEVRATSRHVPSEPRMVTALVSWSKPTCCAETSLATMRSTFLASKLGRGPARHVVGLGREPDEHLPAATAPTELGQDVGRGLEHELGHPVGLRQLGFGRRLQPEVRHRGRHHHDVGADAALEHGRFHLRRGLHPHDRRCPTATAGCAVVTRTTSAPRAAAASATAWPCLPDERLEMKRTGSIGSARAARAHHHTPSGEVAAAPRRDAQRPPVAAATMSAGSARRPAPTSPPASRPSPGSTTCTPRRRSVARFSCTAGCSHISVCMAGHTITGARVASTVAVEQPVGDPVGVAAEKARRRRRPRAPDRRVWPRWVCGNGVGLGPQASVCTGSEASAEKVTSPTNRVASSVRTGTTCAPASTSRRHTSTALYAAMPPVTPKTTVFPSDGASRHRPSSRGWSRAGTPACYSPASGWSAPRRRASTSVGPSSPVSAVSSAHRRRPVAAAPSRPSTPSSPTSVGSMRW